MAHLIRRKRTFISGLKYFRYLAIPPISPPPPHGTKTTSTSGRSSMISILKKNGNNEKQKPFNCRSVRVAERLGLPTSVHGVAGSNPAGGEILLEPKRRFIAQSLSCSPFHRLEMTEILLKGCKTLIHPSIL